MQAEAQGGGLDGKLASFGLGAGERLVQPVPQLLVLRTQALVLVEQLLAGRTGQLSVGDGVLDLAGMVVGDLPRTAAVLGVAGDVTMRAEEDGSGIADTREQG